MPQRGSDLNQSEEGFNLHFTEVADVTERLIRVARWRWLLLFLFRKVVQKSLSFSCVLGKSDLFCFPDRFEAVGICRIVPAWTRLKL